MGNETVKLILTALYNLFLQRIQYLGVVRNFVQEQDIYGDES